jgi:hypothetical protein
MSAVADAAAAPGVRQWSDPSITGAVETVETAYPDPSRGSTQTTRLETISRLSFPREPSV